LFGWVKPQWRCKPEGETVLLEDDRTAASLGVLFVALELRCCSVFGAMLSLSSGARLLLWNASLALAVLPYAFCLSCAGNNVWPYEEPGENSNK